MQEIRSTSSLKYTVPRGLLYPGLRFERWQQERNVSSHGRTRAAAQKPSSLLRTAGGAPSPSPPRGARTASAQTAYSGTWKATLQVGSRDRWCPPCWPKGRVSPGGTLGPGPTEECKVEYTSQKTFSCDWQTLAYQTYRNFFKWQGPEPCFKYCCYW